MALEFQNYSIVAGTPYCPQDCYFCVSKMTTSEAMVETLANRKVDVDWRNFRKASRLAEMGGVTTVLITGKGEPIAYPKEITAYLEALDEYRFPLIELQTAGILFSHKIYQEHDHLQDWYDRGLNTVIQSIVSIDPEQNQAVYMKGDKEYPNLERNIDMLHEKGFTVRLGVVGLKDHVDTAEKLEEVVEYCKERGVEQLTWRPVTQATNSQDPSVNEKIIANSISTDAEFEIHDYVESHGTPLLNLVHGAKVFDLHGQNVCLTSCLTRDPDSEELRQLIFYSTGEITYDWEYPGAIILGKGATGRGLESLVN